MQIAKSPIDNIEMIARASVSGAETFQELRAHPQVGLMAIRRFRSGIDTLLKDFDRRYVRLAAGDVEALTEWANRLRSIRNHLDTIDGQLTVANTKSFDWDVVLRALGYINAQRVAIEQTLAFNESPKIE